MSDGPLDLHGKLALTDDEAAAALGLCKDTIQQLRKDAGLPFIKIGRAVRIPVTALDEWLRERAEVELQERVGELARLRHAMLGPRKRRKS
jgi:excisionase family DNA binding protein